MSTTPHNRNSHSSLSRCKFGAILVSPFCCIESTRLVCFTTQVLAVITSSQMPVGDIPALDELIKLAWSLVFLACVDDRWKKYERCIPHASLLG